MSHDNYMTRLACMVIRVLARQHFTLTTLPFQMLSATAITDGGSGSGDGGVCVCVKHGYNVTNWNRSILTP